MTEIILVIIVLYVAKGLRADRGVPRRVVPGEDSLASMSLPYHIGNGRFGASCRSPPRRTDGGGHIEVSTSFAYLTTAGP